jgi:hypothetical protein
MLVRFQCWSIPLVDPTDAKETLSFHNGADLRLAIEAILDHLDSLSLCR